MAVSAVVASGGDGGVRAGRTEEGERSRRRGGVVAPSRCNGEEPGRLGGRRRLRGDGGRRGDGDYVDAFRV